MRDNTGKLVINLGDNTSERVVAPFVPNPSSSINENQTRYTLFPESINRTPLIAESILDASSPVIKREELSIKDQSQTLYLSADGIVRVALGSSFTLKVKAIQPQTLNVDNGVPVIKQRDEQLIYNWSKDGEVISGEIYLQDYPKSVISVISGSELRFTNISADAEGSYTCEIANDVGITTTEIIEISVFNPDSPYDTQFKQNLVQNSLGLNGVEGWTTSFGEIKSKPLLVDLEGQESIAKEARKQWSDIVGYNSDMFYPHPKNIINVNQRFYENELNRLANNQAAYFTREDLTYLIAGGSRKVVAYQDVDLTDAVDFISGRVYGVTKVRAMVSCYIGNGVSRFLPTEDVITIADKKNPNKYDLSSPRLSETNMARAGVSRVSEKVQVIFQELYDDQPIKSNIVDTQSGRTNVVENITFIDPLTEAGNLARANTAALAVNIGGKQLTLSGDDPATTEIRRFRILYQNNKDLYFTNGQYVKHNAAYIDGLNKLTNKIRIYLIFDIDDIRMSELWDPYTSLRQLKDIASFEKVYSSADIDPFKETDRFINSILQQNTAVPADQRVPFNAESRGMVTGINVSLYPITPHSKLTTTTSLEFPKSILKLPTRVEDLISRGFNISTSSNESILAP